MVQRPARTLQQCWKKCSTVSDSRYCIPTPLPISTPSPSPQARLTATWPTCSQNDRLLGPFERTMQPQGSRARRMTAFKVTCLLKDESRRHMRAGKEARRAMWLQDDRGQVSRARWKTGSRGHVRGDKQAPRAMCSQNDRAQGSRARRMCT